MTLQKLKEEGIEKVKKIPLVTEDEIRLRNIIDSLITKVFQAGQKSKEEEIKAKIIKYKLCTEEHSKSICESVKTCLLCSKVELCEELLKII